MIRLLFLWTFPQGCDIGCVHKDDGGECDEAANTEENRIAKVTISVTNNQMPLQPLFSPVYSSTRAYSQTRSNTQRELMQPDEILRLDTRKCIALFNHHKPALLYKLTPEELPDYASLSPCRIKDYVPAWLQREEKTKRKRKPRTKSAKGESSAAKNLHTAPQTRNTVQSKGAAKDLEVIYDLPDLKKSPQLSEELGMVEQTDVPQNSGMVEVSLGDLLADLPSEEDELPPRR